MNKEYHKLIHEVYSDIDINNSLAGLPFMNIKNLVDLKNIFIQPDIESNIMFVTHLPNLKYRGEQSPIDFSFIRVRIEQYNRIRVRDFVWNVTYSNNSISYMSDSEINDYSITCLLFLLYSLKYILKFTKIENYTIDTDGINISIKLDSVEMKELNKIKQDIVDSCIENNTGIAILTSSVAGGISTNVLRFSFKSDISEFIGMEIPKENLLELLLHEHTNVDCDNGVRMAFSIALL